MSILDYIEKIKQENEGPRITAQEPRNMYAGGQLVQNTADGSRPGYQGPEKYITPARRSGAEGFQGQKFYQVDDPTYSDGRRIIKTKEYKAWLD